MTHLWEGIVWLFHTMGTTYADFFSMNTIHDITSDPLGNLWNVLLLVIMEGLLSADNAIVLAVMVSVLPKHLQKKALFYGMAGAILFRLFAVGIGTTLVKLEIVTVLGGAYLLYLAIKHFLPNRDDGDAVEPAKKIGSAALPIASMSKSLQHSDYSGPRLSRLNLWILPFR